MAKRFSPTKFDALRRRHDLSYGRLGVLTQQVPSRISLYCRGLRAPSLTTAVKLADALGVSIYELLEEDPSLDVVSSQLVD